MQEHEEREPGQAEAPTKPARKHRATYARDNRNGGYLIRVQGPTPEKYAGREVPVTLRNGSEQVEKLQRLIWTGNDKDTSERVALYAFEPKPREQQEIAF